MKPALYSRGSSPVGLLADQTVNEQNGGKDEKDEIASCLYALDYLIERLHVGLLPAHAAAAFLCPVYSTDAMPFNTPHGRDTKAEGTILFLFSGISVIMETEGKDR